MLPAEAARSPFQAGVDVIPLYRTAMNIRERFGQSRFLWVFLGIVLVLCIGVVDYITGPELSFSIFYLVPIIFACLYVDLPAGIILSVVSVGVSLAADLAAARAHGDFATAYWNTGVKLCVFLVVTYLLAGRMKAEKKVQVYAQLHEIDREILAETNPEQVAHAALKGLQKLLSFQASTVVLFEPEQESGSMLAWMCDQNDVEVPAHFSLSEAGSDLSELMNGRTVQIHIPQGLPLLPFEDITWCALIPLLYQNELVGSLNLGTNHSKAFSSQELDFGREVSRQLTVAVMNARLFERLRESRDRLKSLSQRLLEVQEQEKRHLARELHDEMGQALTAIKISLQTVENLPKSSELRLRMRENSDALESILQQVRSLTLDLRPLMLDDLGLVAALRWYLSKQSQIAGFTAHFSAEPSEIQVSSEIGTACFRIVQEAITNVVRHSEAKKVNLQLIERNSHIHCTIQDDGVGFDVNAAEERAREGRSLGLLGMRERVTLAGGQIEIESVPSFGTEIRAVFPLNTEQSR